jgi:Septum formation initiator.|tara:strand:- start:276 stop:581 length:306 start_codon:yes stop_codon:yes gene_type:complete
MLDKIKKNYFLLISTFLLLYFFFNLFGGERGLISNIKKKNILIKLENEEIELSNKIKDLEKKNSLLTDNLDLDYIETIIRKKFLFGKKKENIYIIDKTNED